MVFGDDMNLMKIPRRRGEIKEKQEEKREVGWIVTRALEEKLEKTGREDGFRFLSLFFHFGPPFFSPLYRPQLSLPVL